MTKLLTLLLPLLMGGSVYGSSAGDDSTAAIGMDDSGNDIDNDEDVSEITSPAANVAMIEPVIPPLGPPAPAAPPPSFTSIPG